MTERHITPLPRAPGLEVLSEEANRAVHEKTLEVLDRTGVNVRSERILKTLEDAGARVDLDAARAWFPPEMVEEMRVRAPRAFTLAAREPELDLPLDGEHGYLAMDGSAAEIVDLATGARRPSTKADLAEATRLADALPQISFVWQSVAARDVPTRVQPLHELHAQLANTGKHIQLMTAVTPDAAAGAIEMARIVAGGDEALRARPILSSFQCSISPLTYDGDPIEAAVLFAEAGVPCGFVAMPISCATAPATPAGTLVVSNAEVLAGIVMLEALVPGAPTFYGSCATVMDLRSGAAACGGPEDLLYQRASAQLASLYGVPSNIGTFATGAKAPDWQGGIENALSVISSWIAGADMLCGAGLLYAARVFAHEQMLLDTELFDIIRHMAGVFEFSDEDLAVDVIEKVGPGGHFLAAHHTLKNMRRLWRSRFYHAGTWEEWEAAGRPEPRDRARTRAREILAEHVPAPLPDGVDEELQGVIGAYERHG